MISHSDPSSAHASLRRRVARAVVWLAVVIALGVAALVAVSSIGASGPGGGEDGFISDDASVGVRSDVAAVTRLDAGLREALEAADTAAATDGIHLGVTSGWRSAAYQEQLFREAVTTYGSEEAAREFVAPPEHSRHVTGDAVDIGPLEAQLWLLEHGYEFGLCQTYSNERWHFEFVTEPGGECPEMRLDASADWS